MVSGGLSSSRASEATQPRQPVAPTTTMAPTVLELVLTLKVEAPATPVPEEVSVAPEPLADEPATSKATPTTRQLVAPDSTPLQSILVDAEYRSLRELGGLSRNDRLTRAWRSGVALRGWYFDQAADSVLPAPPAKITVWGYIVQGGRRGGPGRRPPTRRRRACTPAPRWTSRSVLSASFGYFAWAFPML